MRNLIVGLVLLFSASMLQADAPAKKSDKPFNTVCPVSGEKVTKGKTVTYNGKVYGFCCDDCVKSFNKDPKKYSTHLSKDGKKTTEHGGMSH